MASKSARAGRSEADRRNLNHVLVRRFLRNAAASLSENGCIAITVVNGPHYDGIFAMREAARWEVFQGTAFIPFTSTIIQAIVLATPKITAEAPFQ